MEVFSTVAGALAVAELAGKLVISCNNFAKSVKNSKDEIERLQIECSHIRDVLQTIAARDAEKRNNSDGVDSNWSVVKKIVQGCREELEKIEGRLTSPS